MKKVHEWVQLSLILYDCSTHACRMLKNALVFLGPLLSKQCWTYSRCKYSTRKLIRHIPHLANDFSSGTRPFNICCYGWTSSSANGSRKYFIKRKSLHTKIRFRVIDIGVLFPSPIIVNRP